MFLLFIVTVSQLKVLCCLEIAHFYQVSFQVLTFFFWVLAFVHSFLVCFAIIFSRRQLTKEKFYRFNSFVLQLKKQNIKTDVISCSWRSMH